MQRNTLEFVTNLTKVVSTLSYKFLNTQGAFVATCEESIEDNSMKERLENPVGDEGGYFVLEQLEEPMVIEEKEEVVEDLGDVESPWECSIMENSSKKLAIDVEEGAQPPKHIMVEDFEEVDQEMDSIIDEFLSTIESSPIELDIEGKEEDTSPPIPLVSHEENIKLEGSYQEEEVEVDISCQEVEVTREEHKSVDIAIAKCGEVPLPKPPSPNITFKWVKFLSQSFTFSLEYGLIENDGQLRALCGVKSKREWCNGWKKKC